MAPGNTQSKAKKNCLKQNIMQTKKRKEDDGGLGVGEPARRARGETGLCWVLHDYGAAHQAGPPADIRNSGNFDL